MYVLCSIAGMITGIMLSYFLFKVKIDRLESEYRRERLISDYYYNYYNLYKKKFLEMSK